MTTSSFSVLKSRVHASAGISRGKRALLGLFASILIPASASAATLVWVGADNNWTTATNWSLSTLPTSGDDLQFSTSGSTKVTISGLAGFANRITFVAGANSFAIDGTQTLTVNDITNSSTNGQDFSVSTMALGANATWSADAGALSIYSAVNLGSRQLTLKSNGGHSSVISGLISGTGSVKVESGTWTLSNSSNSYSGSTSISGGTLAVTANGALGSTSATTSISGGATLDFRNVTYTNAQSLTSSSSTIAASVGTSSFAGPISISGGGDALTVNVGGTLLTLSGIISGGGADKLTKTGAGTLTLSGASANTYTGDTIINGGTLILGKTAGVNAISGGVITVNAGATLRLGASNQIASTVDLQLNGGTFALFNFSETLGKLDLTVSGGTINFGGSASSLVFAKSAGENWNGGALSITSYTTASNSLRFGTDNTGLTSTQLASITFAGYGAGALIDASGFVTPVPEPEIWAALVGIVALAVAGRRRRTVGVTAGA